MTFLGSTCSLGWMLGWSRISPASLQGAWSWALRQSRTRSSAKPGHVLKAFPAQVPLALTHFSKVLP